jgi:hypothetical protein
MESDFMDATLHAVKGGIAPTGSDQLVMRAVLDEAAALDGDDTVCDA